MQGDGVECRDERQVAGGVKPAEAGDGRLEVLKGSEFDIKHRECSFAATA